MSDADGAELSARFSELCLVGVDVPMGYARPHGELRLQVLADLRRRPPLRACYPHVQVPGDVRRLFAH